MFWSDEIALASSAVKLILRPRVFDRIDIDINATHVVRQVDAAGAPQASGVVAANKLLSCKNNTTRDLHLRAVLIRIS